MRQATRALAEGGLVSAHPPGMSRLSNIGTGAAADKARAEIAGQLGDVRRQLDNLVEGLARTGASAKLTAAIRDREARQGQLERELADLERCEQLSHTEVERLEVLVREKVSGWRKLLQRHVPQARQILAKVLREKLTFTPERRRGQQG